MSDGLTPEPSPIPSNIVERFGGINSKKTFAAILVLLAVTAMVAEFPYGSFLLILSVLLLAKPRVGAVIFLISAIGLYATSAGFYEFVESNEADSLNCDVENWEEIEACATELFLLGTDQDEIEHKFFTRMGTMTYPLAASVFGAEYEATAEVEFTEDGSLRLESIVSKGSDMRPLFDEGLKDFVSGSVWVKTDSPNITFPATGYLTMRFKLEGDAGDVVTGGWVDVLLITLFYLAIFLVAGSILQSNSNPLDFAATVAIPTGIYVAAFYTCVAVSTYTTTNYLQLGLGLLIGLVFMGVGVTASVYRKTPKLDANSDTNPVAYLLLALLPVVGIAATHDPFVSFFVDGPHGYNEEVGMVFGAVFNVYVIALLILVLAFNWLLGERFSTRRKLDVLILSSTALVAVSIVVWFFQMDAITDDYVAIFPALEIAAIGLACTSLLFIFAVLSSKKSVPKLAYRRRVLLLLEVFTFYLFFAYAPASVSQLGQQFVQSGVEQEEQRILEERLKTIEELLDIEPIESDEIDDE